MYKIETQPRVGRFLGGAPHTPLPPYVRTRPNASERVRTPIALLYKKTPYVRTCPNMSERLGWVFRNKSVYIKDSHTPYFIEQDVFSSEKSNVEGETKRKNREELIQ